MALALSTPAAQAQELTLSDGTRDVWVSSTDSPGFTHVDSSKHADIRWVQVRHGATGVVLTAKLVELTKQGAEVAFFVQFRTNTGLRRDARLSGRLGDRSGSVTFTSRTGQPLKCTIAHKIDYAANTMMVSVPRGCLNSPRYVEFRSETSWMNDSTYKVFIDNPHNAKAEFTGWSNHVLRD